MLRPSSNLRSRHPRELDESRRPRLTSAPSSLLHVLESVSSRGPPLHALRALLRYTRDSKRTRHQHGAHRCVQILPNPLDADSHQLGGWNGRLRRSCALFRAIHLHHLPDALQNVELSAKSRESDRHCIRSAVLLVPSVWNLPLQGLSDTESDRQFHGLDCGRQRDCEDVWMGGT